MNRCRRCRALGSIVTVFIFVFGPSWHSEAWVATKMRKGKRALPLVSLSITSNAQNYNVFTSAGSPSSATEVIVTIQAGVTVSSASASIAALRSGSLPAGSTLKIINSGNIIGCGGSGGAGGGSTAGSAGTNGSAGSDGGHAIETTVALTIDNTAGNIFAGGGGAGGGGGGYGTVGAARGAGGGGGGGGAGSCSSTGGSGGTASDGRNGTAGSSGASTGGAGGAGWDINAEVGYGAGWGGGASSEGGPRSGGEYGSAGQAGLRGVWYNGAAYTTVSSGGTAGNPGAAVKLNGSSITWVGGNNGTQVKGPIQ